MSKIKIIIDSAATLTEELIKKNNLGVVNLKINWEEENIKETLNGQDLFKKMQETTSNTGPKTSQPSVGDFKKAFDSAFEEGYEEIICAVMSTGMSGTYNSAVQALKFLSKEKQEKISIIDTFSADAGEGLIILKIAELLSKNITRKEIVSKIEIFKKKVFIFGFMQDPKWIERNGRLSKTGASLIRQAEKIGIRPLLTLKKGKVAVTALKFKAKDKIESLLKEVKDNIKEEKAVLTITHANILEEAEDFKKRIEKDCPNVKVLFVEKLSPIIGCHLGPESIICSYYIKEND
ncbi:MAG: DegV family protein [Candidatus Pacebacteria bacterium]|nr:DegV family protein [Candidatus Paceibacterota bacterium]